MSNTAPGLSRFGVASSLVLLSLGLSSCSQPPLRDTAEAQAVAELEAVEGPYFDAMQRGDVEAMMPTYTEDAILLPPGGAMVRGKAAIRQFWTSYLGQAKDIEVRRDRAGIEVLGNTLWEVTTYHQRARWKNGAVTDDDGKWLTVRKRQADGSWKTRVISWSSNHPPAPATPAAEAEPAQP